MRLNQLKLLVPFRSFTICWRLDWSIHHHFLNAIKQSIDRSIDRPTDRPTSQSLEALTCYWNGAIGVSVTVCGVHGDGHTLVELNFRAGMRPGVARAIFKILNLNLGGCARIEKQPITVVTDCIRFAVSADSRSVTFITWSGGCARVNWVRPLLTTGGERRQRD